MQATARRLSVVSAPSCARRRLIRIVGRPCTMTYISIAWLMHFGIAALLTAPIVFMGRRRVRWQPWELSALIVPFTVWALLMVSDLSTRRKSLSNLFGEPIFFSLAIPIAAAFRVLLGSSVRESIFACGLIFSLCVLTAIVFFVAPSLPE
jgi:hypothetical protein